MEVLDNYFFVNGKLVRARDRLDPPLPHVRRDDDDDASTFTDDYSDVGEMSESETENDNIFQKVCTPDFASRMLALTDGRPTVPNHSLLHFNSLMCLRRHP
jgi:hypothetical protein